MVQMQYQARVDMVQFIDLLEKACIRFVHFSKENELRSRVFSEKMGLESGWNCHISLAPGANLTKATSLMYGIKEEIKPKEAEDYGKLWPRFGLLGSSLPAKLNVNNRFIPGWREVPLLTKGKEVLLRLIHNCKFTAIFFQGSVVSEDCSDGSLETFGHGNRAQLPAGIDAIRPHLDKMDNVPLLVSLFTDCTPSSTRQMVEIMQEHGEVVAMLGSSANFHNMRSFLVADASLAVEPLYPQVI